MGKFSENRPKKLQNPLKVHYYIHKMRFCSYFSVYMDILLRVMAIKCI